MQNSSGKSQASPDERANAVEDSPLMTIYYLRGRLLSERSVSKAAKERVDELAKRVKELEEQLKIVSIQRRQAEKATLDVLSFLECHGVSDFSEVYESECDEEDSLDESNVIKSREDENFGSKESKENGIQSSDSEHESTPSSSGSLSWKGRKKISQLLQKKNFDSPIQRGTNFPLVNPTPRHRLGKSCRQVKRRERSVVEELRHDSLKSDVKDSSTLDNCDHHDNFLDTSGEKLKNSTERWAERGFRKDEASVSLQNEAQDGDASSSNRGNECNGQMGRALKHEARLLGFYEAQEKAQRDWEEKYGDNQVSTTDSCEPGNHSDVTEERDENRATIPHPGDIAACNGNDQKAGTETHFQNKSSINHLNSFKLSPHADTGRSRDDELDEVQSSRSPAPDFAFPTLTSNQIQQKHEVPFDALSGDNTLRESHSHYANPEGQHASVPHEGLQLPEMVLDALQEAKAMLKQRMNRLPETRGSAERATETSVPAVNDVDWVKIPAACPGIFRVPTDFPLQAPSYGLSLVSHNAKQLTDSHLRARSPYMQGYQNSSGPVDSRFNNLSSGAYSSTPVYAPEFGPARPRVDFRSSNNIASSSESTTLPYSCSLPRISSNPMLFSLVPRSEVAIPPSGNQLYKHDPSTYR